MRPVFLGYEGVRGFDGQETRGERVDVDADALVRHAFVCGATGSGKTVFAKSIVEEAVLAGVPVIAVDLKGDIASLALSGPLGQRTALTKVFGTDGEAAYREYTEGLGRHSASAQRAAQFGDRAEVRLFTPNAPIGHQVALAGLPSFPEAPRDPLERSDRDELTATLVRGFAATVFGEGRLKINEPAVKLLEELVRWCNDQGEVLEGAAGIRRILELVQSPPFESLGGLSLKDYVAPRHLEALRTGLNGRIVGAERSRYDGPTLSVDTLLSGVRPGRTPLSVVYLGHLTDFADQSLILGQLCADVYRWMRRTGGTDRLRLLVYVDELGGGDNKLAFYPSAPYNPPSKAPLNLLVKQGRSAGVGVLLATQNPMSVDVRALGNVNTWAIGRLTQRNDHDRIKDVLERMPQGAARALQAITQMQTGSFLVASDALTPPKVVRERWLYSVHRQLSATQLRAVHQLLEAARGGQVPGGAPEPEREDSPSSPAGPPPPAPEPKLAEQPVLEPPPTSPTPRPVGVYRLVPPPSTEEATKTVTWEGERGWRVRMGERVWLVPTGGLTIGRSSSADVHVDDPTVSGSHVELMVDGRDLLVRATSSKNPTYVDGRLLSGETRLEDGEHQLLLGRSTLTLVRGELG